MRTNFLVRIDITDEHIDGRWTTESLDAIQGALLDIEYVDTVCLDHQSWVLADLDTEVGSTAERRAGKLRKQVAHALAIYGESGATENKEADNG